VKRKHNQILKIKKFKKRGKKQTKDEGGKKMGKNRKLNLKKMKMN
jgi:hypothetical protein